MTIQRLALRLFPLVVLATQLSHGVAVDRLLFQQALDISLLPRGDPAVNIQIQKAIMEIVNAHINMARGTFYPMGAATGLFPATVGRKKRFATFGSSFGSDWGSDRHDWGFPWSSFYGGGKKYNNYNDNKYNDNKYNDKNAYNYPSNTNKNQYSNKGYYGGNTFKSFGDNKRREIIHCPTQTNQSAVYMLNASSVSYPTNAIGNEFFARSLPGSDLFFQCAIRRAILPGQGPTVEVDQNFVTANHTCHVNDLAIFNYMYQNTAIGGRCWIVQGFQEPVLASICTQKTCENCKLGPKPVSIPKKVYGHPGHPYPHPHPHPQQSSYGTRNVTVNQCLNEYRTTQVLSYCENLPVNQRIIYDRIIIPISCSCKSVDCMTNPHW